MYYLIEFHHKYAKTQSVSYRRYVFLLLEKYIRVKDISWSAKATEIEYKGIFRKFHYKFLPNSEIYSDTPYNLTSPESLS